MHTTTNTLPISSAFYAPLPWGGGEWTVVCTCDYYRTHKSERSAEADLQTHEC